MNNKSTDQESFRTLQLMTELEEGSTVSQRELAGRLGVAVGLVNSYLKNFVSKGYVRVKNYPRNRYAYLLTPKGFAEKSRLALHHLNYFTNLYTITRQEYLELFRQLKADGVVEVVFCGVDEVAEIAYMSLQEAGLKLSSVIDESYERRELFGQPIRSFPENWSDISGEIVLTTLKRGADLRKKLREHGWQHDIYAPPALLNGDM
ncbi:winged helix-turn-helix transcriptional regulator [Deltaproteobacteria bacterium IMCC39524]|nr:winged helix-turn-helix transcriptional regulator [Deltaproteobacteria bacterium IMCC39524]